MPVRRFTDEQEAEIARQYLTRNPNGTWTGAKELGRAWGVRHQTIYNVLDRQGVATRDARESHAHGKRCKPLTSFPPAGEPTPLCRCGCGEPVVWDRSKPGWNVYVAGHQHPDAPFKHEAWLRAQYVDAGRTVEDIAAECGVSRMAVISHMQRFGIERRNRSDARIGRQAGERNPAWRGGTTPERQRLYKSQYWKAVVREVYARDGYTCRRCGGPKPGPRGLHAHHIRPWATNPALRMDRDNLVTLCGPCHAWVHSVANVNRDWLALDIHAAGQ